MTLHDKMGAPSAEDKRGAIDDDSSTYSSTSILPGNVKVDTFVIWEGEELSHHGGYGNNQSDLESLSNPNLSAPNTRLPPAQVGYTDGHLNQLYGFNHNGNAQNKVLR